MFALVCRRRNNADVTICGTGFVAGVWNKF